MAKTRTRAKPAQRGYVPAVPLRLVDDAMGFLELDIDRGRLTPREVFEQMRQMVESGPDEDELDELREELEKAEAAEVEARNEASDIEDERDDYRQALGCLIEDIKNIAGASKGDPESLLAEVRRIAESYAEPANEDWLDHLDGIMSRRLPTT